MDKPRLLDLFSGAGGAGMGYHRAGFEVVGVDIAPMPRYPFEFHCADALEYAAAHGHEFDAIHASPPCQAHSWSSTKHRNLGKVYPDFLPQTQALLAALGKPFIIENVLGAPMSTQVVLCGTQFGLKVFRHRLFESNCLLVGPGGRCSHEGAAIGFDDDSFVTVAGHGADGSGRMDKWCEAMGIDWMNRDELTEAIPPAYTNYLGLQLMRYVLETHSDPAACPRGASGNESRAERARE